MTGKICCLPMLSRRFSRIFNYKINLKLQWGPVGTIINQTYVPNLKVHCNPQKEKSFTCQGICKKRVNKSTIT